MEELDGDLYAVACNYLEATNVASEGTKAFVCFHYLGGNLPERIKVVARSRGGRWIEKWENTRRLGNYRIVTIPPEHPMRSVERRDVALASREHAEQALARLAEVSSDVR